MYAEGQICPVGKVLIAIESRGRARPQATPLAPRRARRARVDAARRCRRTGERSARRATTASTRATRAVLATPATRKLARDIGVDIRDGDRHRTGRARSPRTTCAAARAAAHGRAARRRRRRADRPTATTCASRSAACARRSPRTWCARSTTAAHFTYVEEVDCTELVGAARARQRAPGGGTQACKLSFLPFIVKATAAGAGEVSPAQRHARRGGGRDRPARALPHRAGHRDRGRADRAGGARRRPAARSSSWPREIERLAALTRTGKAAREELAGSTFTITSLGALGGRAGDADHQLSRGGDPGRPQDQPSARPSATTRSSSATS